METLVAYLISVGLIAFGVLIVIFGARTASGSLLVWTISGLVPVVVGLASSLARYETAGQDISAFSQGRLRVRAAFDWCCRCGQASMEIRQATAAMSDRRGRSLGRRPRSIRGRRGQFQFGTPLRRYRFWLFKNSHRRAPPPPRRRRALGFEHGSPFRKLANCALKFEYG